MFVSCQLIIQEIHALDKELKVAADFLGFGQEVAQQCHSYYMRLVEWLFMQIFSGHSQKLLRHDTVCRSWLGIPIILLIILLSLKSICSHTDCMYCVCLGNSQIFTAPGISSS